MHRVGRTGRAGKKGTAHTLFDPAVDKKSAYEFSDVLKRANQTIPDWLEQLASR
eukprot:SAG25_NODE_7212_length_496_cov_0.654912_2_plen_53_part_01